MSIPFHPRAVIYTSLVMAAFVALAAVERPAWLGGGDGGSSQSLLSLGGGGEGQRDEPREVVTALLRHEALIQGQGPTCVQLTSASTTLADQRAHFAAERHALRLLPDGARARRLNAWLVESPDWRRPLQSLGDRDVSPVGPDARRMLEQFLPRRIRTVVDGVPPVGIAAEDLPVPLLPATSECDRTLRFAAPDLAGELALAEARLVCGPGCARTRLYALQRRSSGWQLIAVAPL